MAYGLTEEGFIPKTAEIIIAEMNERLRVEFSIKPRGILSKLRDIIAETAAQLWELGEEVVSSGNPDDAIGAAQDAICAYTGTFRRPASKSSVTPTLTGTPTTLVPGGSQATAVTSGTVFETIDDATIVALTAWAAATIYAVGARRTNSGQAYICTVAGASGGTGPVAELAGTEVDGTVTWRWLGEGAGAVDAPARGLITGPYGAAAYDITERTTPVGGWSGVINLADSIDGEDIESHEDLRERREEELAASGTGTLPAIRSAVLRILDADGNNPVVSCTVFRNNTDTTNADGMPPHSIEALVRIPNTAANDQLVAECLFNNVSGPARTHGTVTVTYEDSEGTDHEYKFTRPTEIPVYAILNVVADEDTWPVDGADQIKAAIVAWGDLQKAGRDVESTRIASKAFIDDSVIKVSTCFIGTAPAPAASTTIAVALRELATYATTRITVNVTFDTP